ncbi:MAG: formylglycine-generating enzyme family protein [Pirellula sp.]
MRRFQFTSWRSTRSRVLSVAAGALAAVAGMAAPSFAGTVTFGSGANAFNMEFVKIGNPGNAADTTGKPNPAGAVGYEYAIGKFEVSESMITKFNASQSLQITQSNRGPNKPATFVSWNEAARFVNWLNTQRGFAPAYKFTTTGVNDNIALWTSLDTLDYDSSNRYRSLRAKYFLPNFNESYKAAFYNLSEQVYYDFPNGKNTAPTAVASGTADNTAVYGLFGIPGSVPADVDQAGGLSPYGVMGLAGNVYEHGEDSYNSLNNDPNEVRTVRGGSWLDSDTKWLSSSFRLDFEGQSWLRPTWSDDDHGFRVASLDSDAIVSEPSMMVIGTLFGLGGLVAKRRRKK